MAGTSRAGGACAALLLVAAWPAAAQSPATAGIAIEEEETGGSRWGGWIIAETSLGFGTFVGGFADDPFAAQAVSLRPSYRIDGFPGTASLILRQDASWEFTQPDAPGGRRFDYADTMLWFVAPALWTEPASGVTLGGEARLTLPISYESRMSDRITALTVGPRFSRDFGPFSAQLRLLATKHFFAHSNVGLARDEATGRDGIPFAHCREGEEWCAGGAYVPSWGASVYGLLGYALSDALSASVALQYAATWRVAAPDDAFTSRATDTAGNRVVQRGLQRSADVAMTTLDLAYQLTGQLGFSAGVITEMPTRTADNRRFRFHLIDLATPANNYSSLYFDVIASF